MDRDGRRVNAMHAFSCVAWLGFDPVVAHVTRSDHCIYI
jgi:hypothetical protein